MKRIGPYRLRNNLFLAPMVGVSDTPFREICSAQGAGLTIGEMLTCNSDLWHNERNRRKRVQPAIPGPRVVQIAGADGVMIGRAAQGRPWLFREVEAYLTCGRPPGPPSLPEQLAVVRLHLKKLHGFYGPVKGVWFARKHVGAYVKNLRGAREFLRRFNAVEAGPEQLHQLEHYFHSLTEQEGAIAA